MTFVLQGLVCVQMLLFLLSKCPGMKCVCVCVFHTPPPTPHLPNTVYFTEPRDGEKVYESLGCQAQDCVTLKNFKKLPPVSRHDCTIIYYSQQFVIVQVVSHPHQHFVWPVFLMLAVLVGIQWQLICGFELMISDVENIFMCILAIGVSVLVKCLFISSAHF